MNNKIRSTLGLCKQARLLVEGESMCEKALQSNNAKLIIVAENASENTKKKFTNKSNYYRVPIIFFSTKEELGRSLGAEIRATVVIMDENFSAKINSLINESES